jgi:hypothetical protein
MPIISITQEAEIERIMFQGETGQKINKRVGEVAQVAEHLPSKCKFLSSNSSIAKKNKNPLYLMHDHPHMIRYKVEQ